MLFRVSVGLACVRSTNGTKKRSLKNTPHEDSHKKPHRLDDVEKIVHSNNN